MEIKKSAKERLQSRIDIEKIKPKSTWHFVVSSIVTLLFTIFGLLISLYMANLIGALQTSHEYLRLLKHGNAGFRLLLPSLPLGLIASLVFSFIVMIVLLRRYYGLYRFSLLKVVSAGFMAVALATYLLLRFDSSLIFLRIFGIESKSLKAFHNHYFEGKQGHIVHGEVIAINANQLTMQLSGSTVVFTAQNSSSTQGIKLEEAKLPQSVFMLVDGPGFNPQVLYIGHPQQQ